MISRSFNTSYSIKKETIPQSQKKILVKLHSNDGLRYPHAGVLEELNYDNNILEVELDLPGR